MKAVLTRAVAAYQGFHPRLPECWDVCDVIMDEFEIVGLGVHGDEDKHKFRRVRMNAKK